MPVAPAVEQGSRQHGQVVGGREESGVARDAAERPGVLVVHLATDHRTVRPGLGLRGRDPVDQSRRRVEHRVRHPQRAGDPAGDHRVQRPSGDLLDDQAERDQAEVGVDVGHARLGGRLDRQHGGQPFLDRGVGAVERDPGRQPARVGEQVPDRHVVLAVLGEGREVRRDRLVEVDPAGLDLLHDRDRRERLGHRGEVEDRVPPHRHLLVGRQLGLRVDVPHRLARGVVHRDHAVPRRQHHAAGVQRPRRRGRQERAQVRRHLFQWLGQQVRLLGRAVAQLVVLELQVLRVGVHRSCPRRRRHHEQAGHQRRDHRPPHGRRPG